MSVYSQNDKYHRDWVPAGGGAGVLDDPVLPRAPRWVEGYLHALWWIVVGGALTAFFAWGLLTNGFFFISVPVGSALGLIVGVPGAALVTLVIRGLPQLRQNPRRLVLLLELVGVCGAVGGALHWAGWIEVIRHPEETGTTGIGGIANGAYAVIGVIFSGRWVGRRLGLFITRGAPRRPGREVGNSPTSSGASVRIDVRRPLTEPEAAIRDSDGASAPEAAALPWGVQQRLALTAWWWITVGGALSGFFCAGPYSIILWFVTVPIGAAVGAVAGIPGAAALTAWIRRNDGPPDDPALFIGKLGMVGAVYALAGCGLFAWWWAVPALIGGAHFTPSVVVASVVSVLFAVVAVALSGRWVGRRLAASYLRAWGLAPPPSWLPRLR